MCFPSDICHREKHENKMRILSKIHYESHFVQQTTKEKKTSKEETKYHQNI
jgi:hypothetical protein